MGRLRETGTIIAEVWRGYWRDECIILSAAISYYAIFSVIPFLCLVLVIWGFLLGSTDVLLQQILQFATALVPDISEEVLGDIKSVVEHRGALGWLGIVFLFWVFDVAFYSIAHAFDRIFDRGGKRRYYKIKLFSFASLLVAGCVIYISVYIAIGAALLMKADVIVAGVNVSALLAKGLSFKYVVAVLVFGVCTAILLIVPHTSIRVLYAVSGGLVCTTLWYLSRIAFHWYIENIAVFNIVYGTLGTLVVVVLWIFYSSNILLLSAEFVSVLQKRWDGPGALLTTARQKG